jgi:cytochrome P450
MHRDRRGRAEPLRSLRSKHAPLRGQADGCRGYRAPPGDVIILLLAAANRDPVFNQRPHEFIIDRPARRTLGFGHGMHACPGQLLAGAIASSGVKVALELLSPADIASLGWNYRASVNGRIPMFIEKNTNQEQP